MEDNGIGLPANTGQSPGMGRRIMEYRCGLIGGTYQELVPDQGGTLVACVLPEVAERGDRG